MAAKKHGKRFRTSAKKAAIISGAAVTATAMTVGLAAPSANAAIVPSDPIVPVLDGAGRRAIDRATVEAAVAQLVGRIGGGGGGTGSSVDPAALGLTGGGDATASLVALLQSLSLAPVLAALGIDLPDLSSLLPADLDLPGVVFIGTGPPFFALNVLGIGLGPWVPALPQAIADEINGTEYDTFSESFANPVEEAIEDAVGGFLGGLVCDIIGCGPGTFTAEIPNLRVPVVLAWGPGALSTGLAFQQVVADLPNQPGGTAEGAEDGSSLTILPMALLRNPGRANGGIAARFAPLFAPFGINTVTPDFDVHQDGDAVLVPIKADATVEFDPFSDFPSWPNPFSLANSVAALVFPTYILRGADITGALPAIFDVITEAALDNGGVAATLTVPEILSLDLGIFGDVDIELRQGVRDELGIPDDFFAVNQYFTVRSGALPLLEPLRLPFDVINLLTGGNFSNPFVDAIEPALRMLVNLGYTDVQQDQGYERTLDQAGLNANEGGVPFGTLPSNVNWATVPGDFFNALAQGVQDAFFSGGIPGVHGPGENPQPNALTGLLDLLNGLLSPSSPIGGLGLTNSPNNVTALDDGVDDLVDGLANLPSASVPPADTPAQSVTLSLPVTQSLVNQSEHQEASLPDVSLAGEEQGEQGVADPSDESPALADSSATTVESSTARKRPQLNVITGNGNSASEIENDTPREDAASATGQQDRSGVTDVRVVADNTVDSVESATIGGENGSATSHPGGTGGGSTDAGGSSGAGGDGSGSSDAGGSSD